MEQQHTLQTFRRFNDVETAQEVADFLTSRGLYCQVELLSPSFDATFAYNRVNTWACVLLKSEDFERAEKLFWEFYEPHLAQVEKDYYLLTFTDAELMDVVRKRDEWSFFDFLLAQKLLKERGKDISLMEVQEFRAERLKELAEPDEMPSQILLLGYVFAFLGGVFALPLGWILLFYKKPLPDGSKVYGYSPAMRSHGQMILLISAVTFAISIYLYFKRIS